MQSLDSRLRNDNRPSTPSVKAPSRDHMSLLVVSIFMQDRCAQAALQPRTTGGSTHCLRTIKASFTQTSFNRERCDVGGNAIEKKKFSLFECLVYSAAGNRLDGRYSGRWQPCRCPTAAELLEPRLGRWLIWTRVRGTMGLIVAA